MVVPGIHTDVRLTRSEFEAMIRPPLGETVGALRRAVRSARLEPEQVDKVLLVGGSSRIPLVAEVVGAALGRPIAVDAHPKNAVALGGGGGSRGGVAVVHTGAVPVPPPRRSPRRTTTGAGATVPLPRPGPLLRRPPQGRRPPIRAPRPPAATRAPEGPQGTGAPGTGTPRRPGGRHGRCPAGGWCRHGALRPGARTPRPTTRPS